MKTDVERLNPTRVKLTVEVPFEELKPSLDAAYREVAKQVNIPGFRRGKVPASVIDRRLGRGVVLEQAVQEHLPKAYGEALREGNVKALGQPEVEVTEFADNAPLTFTAEVDTRPDIEVPDYASLAVEVGDADVSDDDVQEQLDGLRERFAVLRGVDRAAAEGDYISIDMQARDEDGLDIDEASVSGMSYEVGSGNLVDGLDEAVTGMEADGTATFSTTLQGEHEGRDASVEVTVNSVKEKQLPELDDEFAQTASEFDTLDELRDDLRSRMQRGKAAQQAAEAREKVLDALLEKADFPVPDGIVEEEVQGRRSGLEQQLAGSGLDLSAYLEAQGQDAEEFDTELRDTALKSVRAGWLLDEVADSGEVEVGEQELNAEVVETAYRMQVDPQAFADHLIQSGQVGQIFSEVRRRKALDVVLGAATVTDASGNAVDLSEVLSPPQADGGAEAQDEAEDGADDADDASDASDASGEAAEAGAKA